MDETEGTIPATESVVATTETSSLIASNRVEGTKVYGRDGDKIGAVHNFMVNKRTGQVAYVVISTGGFLGLGQAYHPLPWSAFSYDEEVGCAGARVMTEEPNRSLKSSRASSTPVTHLRSNGNAS